MLKKKKIPFKRKWKFKIEELTTQAYNILSFWNDNFAV